MPKKMKDSGIEWIGKIPEDWDIIKGKYIYDITTGKLDANAEDIGGIYPFFTCSMEPKKINSYAFDCEALLVAGNGIVGFTQYYKGKFNAYQRTYVLSNFSKIINPKYLKFYVSDLLEEAVTTESYGSVISFIKLDNLKNFYVVFPSIAEQTKIANFLDDKCSKIDKAIELNKKAIEEEKKYKQSYIDNKINNKSFKKIKLKYTIELRNENGISNENFISLENIESYTGKWIKTDTDYKNSNGKIFYKGDLLINKLRPYLAKNHLAVFNGVCTNEMEVVKKFNGNMNYLFYFTMSHRFIDEVNSSTYGTKMPRANWNFIKEIFIPYPSIEQQNQIVTELDKICTDIDKMIKIRQKYIEQLEEYKKSLIYEAVTGKIEV